MTQNADNWGSRARIGMFIVGNEAVPEAEWWAMLPAGVSVHAARVTAAAPWAQWCDGRNEVELAEDLLRGAKQFAAMQLSAVVVGHSSSSFLGGKGWDRAVVNKLSSMFDQPVAVTTNGLDTLAALAALQVTRPFLILPAWFNDRIVAAARRYFDGHDVNLSGCLRYDPGPEWRHLPPEDLYPKGMGFHQEIAPLQSQIIAACPGDADAVLIAGTGFRCVAILEDLEKALNRPVISANQASLWHSLTRVNIPAAIEGYGRLLRLNATGA